MAMFNDRPEVREVMRYLTTAQSTEAMIKNGSVLTPHRDTPIEWYPTAADLRIAQIILSADTYRFDGSDLMPVVLKRCFDEGHPFVAAAGVMRGFPFTTTAANYYEEGVSGQIGPSGYVERLSGFQWLDDLPEALTDVDFCGVPAAIIHRTCFERVAEPWFQDIGEDRRPTTHDVYFCGKLKAAGIPVKVDGTIRCGHLTDAPVITFENRPQARQGPNERDHSVQPAEAATA